MSFLKSISLPIAAIGKFWQEKNNSRIFKWNLIILLVQFILLFIYYNQLPPQLPLYYSRSWGSQQLATPNHLIYLPVISLAVWMANNLLAALYLSKLQLLSRLLVVFSLIFSFLIAITMIQIINLVT